MLWNIGKDSIFYESNTRYSFKIWKYCVFTLKKVECTMKRWFFDLVPDFSYFFLNHFPLPNHPEDFNNKWVPMTKCMKKRCFGWLKESLVQCIIVTVTLEESVEMITIYDVWRSLGAETQEYLETLHLNECTWDILVAHHISLLKHKWAFIFCYCSFVQKNRNIIVTGN